MTCQSNTRERIITIICEYASIEDRRRVTPEARFVEDLGQDSLDVAEIELEVQTAFGIELHVDAPPTVTVGDLIKTVEGQL